ncbi:MAG: glycosyltransferase family 39 protein [Acidimicrobiales bacterium]
MLTSPGPAGPTVQPERGPRWRGLGPLLEAPLFQAAAISVVGFVVILLTAPHGLWLDETISVRRSGLPLTTLTTFSLGGEPNMALFHYLLWPLGQLHAGDTVFRLVPIAAGSLTLGGTFLLGHRLFDRWTAVIATALVAAHGLLTRYATEVRGYSLIMLLMVVAALLLTDAVETDRRRSWVLFAVCALISFGLHFVGVLFVGAQLLALLAVWRTIDRPRAIRTAGAIAAGVATLGVVWVVSDQDYWVSWLPSLSDDVALEVLRAISGGTNLSLVVVGTFVLIGSIAGVLAFRRDPAQRWANALMLSAVWVPLAGGAVASVAHALAYPRYFLAVLPPMALLAARGVMVLPKRSAIPVIAAVALVAGVAVGHRDLDLHAREGTNDASAYVVAHARSGDAVFLPYNEDLSGFQWYADGRLPDGVIDARPGVPPDAIRTDWWWQKASRLGPDMPQFASRSEAEWDARLAPVDRVWILSGFIARDPRFHDTGVDFVPQGRVECDRQFFNGIDVVLWARSCD